MLEDLCVPIDELLHILTSKSTSGHADIGSCLSASSWITSPEVCLSLFPTAGRLAVAYRSSLAIVRFSHDAPSASDHHPTSGPGSGRLGAHGTAMSLHFNADSRATIVSLCALGSAERATALKWAPFVFPTRRAGVAFNPADCLTGLVLLGTSFGFLQIHSEDGQMIHRQKLNDTPVESIQLRTAGMELLPRGGPGAVAEEDVTLTFADALVVISSQELSKLLLKARQSGVSDRTEEQHELACVKWSTYQLIGSRLDGVNLGRRPQPLLSVLAGAPPTGTMGESESGKPKKDRWSRRLMSGRGGQGAVDNATVMHILTCGKDPPLAIVEVEAEADERSAAGKSRALNATSLARAFSSVFWAGRNDGRAAAHGQGGGAGSIEADAVPQAMPAKSVQVGLVDSLRVTHNISVCPHGRIAVANDSLGRLMLVDLASSWPIGLWKGYRDVQVAWCRGDLPSSAPDHAEDARSCSGAGNQAWKLNAGGPLVAPAGECAEEKQRLAIYAPKRRLLELWLPRSRHRVGSRQVDEHCQLLQPVRPFGMQQLMLEEQDALRALLALDRCFLLEGATGEMQTVQ